MSEQKNLMTDVRFWPIFWTQFFGAFNDNVFKNSLVILIAFKSFTLMGLNADQMVALCGGIFILPFFLFSALAGQISDKYPKHKLVTLVKLWEIGVMVLGAIGFFVENIYLLILSLFLMGLQSTFFGPVKFSILPELITEDELTRGNAYFEMGTFLSILLGTILGGVLIGLDGGVGSLAVGISVLVFAIIGTLISLKGPKLEAVSPDLKIQFGIFRPTLEILKITKETKSVFLSILGISWFWFLGAALLSIFPVYVKDVIGGDEHLVTMFLAFFSIGVAIGSLVCEKLSHERVELGLVPIGAFGITIFILDLFFIGKPSIGHSSVSVGVFLSSFDGIRVLFDLFFLSVFSGVFIVPLYTFIQQRSPKAVRSRIIAGNNILNAFFMVASAIALAVAYGVGADVLDVLLVLAALNAVVSLYIFSVIPEFFLRLVCFILTRAIYRLDVEGHYHIPKDGAAVLTCNHVSFVDWLIIAAAVKRPVRFVMHYSFMKSPFLRFILRGAKVIPIAGAKEDPKILTEAFDSISRSLEEGEVVCIFPEGRITNNGEMNSFRTGIEKIINRNPVIVIPMALDGLWGSYFSRKWNGRALSNPRILIKRLWCRIKLNIGKPIEPININAGEIEFMTKDLLFGDSGEVINTKKIS